MKRRYDLVAIGGGTAGIVASTVAAGLGARVALIERDRIGGECLYTGCVPSKALIASAARAHALRTAAALGIAPVEPEVDFTAVMARVRSAIERAGVEDTPEHLRSLGVEVIQSEARFIRPGVVAAGGRELGYRMALIGTGSVTAVPDVPGLERIDGLTNETIFGLEQLPTRLTVLGGGPIGCELAQAMARLGSSVTLVEAGPRLLPAEEAEASTLIGSVFAEEGIDVRLGVEATAAEVPEGGCGRLLLSSGDEVDFDRILLATGRRSVTSSLGLEAVGVEVRPDGSLPVDERLRTSGDRIYAAGDVVGELRFTHVAGHDALTAVTNGLLRTRRRVDRRATPWVTFTDPEVAHVGISEQIARASGGRVEVVRHDLERLDRAITSGGVGFTKLTTGRRGRLLGATIVGPAAGESILEPARLIASHGRVDEIAGTIHPYPTYGEGVARAAEDGVWRRLLTGRTRAALRPLLALGRAIDRPRG